jgi:hypothetical protein
MIVLLYLILLVIFLVLLKNLFLSKENFHIPVGNKEIEKHIHEEPKPTTTVSLLEETINNIPTTDSTLTPIQTTSSSVVSPTNIVNTPSPTQSPPLRPFDPQVPQQKVPKQVSNTAAEAPVKSSIEVLTPEEAQIMIQERVAAEIQQVKSVTAQVDDKCCGVNIYEKKLENINKCVEQHIKNSGSKLNPQYNEWKEVDDEENTCQSPQHILAKTSNCHDIVNDYKDNINSLLCISNKTTENCSYNYKSDEKLHGGLSDRDRMAVFIGNIGCPNNNTFVLDEYPKGSNYFIKKCT